MGRPWPWGGLAWRSAPPPSPGARQAGRTAPHVMAVSTSCSCAAPPGRRRFLAAASGLPPPPTAERVHAHSDAAATFRPPPSPRRGAPPCRACGWRTADGRAPSCCRHRLRPGHPWTARPPPPPPAAGTMSEGKPHLSIVICGHVDSGKSTTTGRLLFELGGIPERELEKLKVRSGGGRGPRSLGCTQPAPRLAQQQHHVGHRPAAAAGAGSAAAPRCSTHAHMLQCAPTLQLGVTPLGLAHPPPPPGLLVPPAGGGLCPGQVLLRLRLLHGSPEGGARAWYHHRLHHQGVLHRPLPLHHHRRPRWVPGPRLPWRSPPPSHPPCRLPAAVLTSRPAAAAVRQGRLGAAGCRPAPHGCWRPPVATDPTLTHPPRPAPPPPASQATGISSRT